MLKRPTPEEEAAGEGGAIKARIVAMELKSLYQLPAELVHADTPGAGAVRMILGFINTKKQRVSTTDYVTAFLQGKPFPPGVEILIALVDPETGITEYW